MNILQRIDALRMEVLALTKITPPVLKSNVNWRMAISRWAKKYGFVKLGSGAFGAVFYNKKKPNIVIKVFSDMSYMRWIQLCQGRLKGNKFVPKFIGKPTRLYRGVDLWFIRIEKLEPIDVQNKEWHYFNQVLKRHLVDHYGAPKAYVRHNSLREENEFKNKQLKGESEDLYEMMDTLGYYLTMYDNFSHFSIDAHANNIMRRGDQIVVIDPIAQHTKATRAMFNLEEPEVPSTDANDD